MSILSVQRPRPSVLLNPPCCRLATSIPRDLEDVLGRRHPFDSWVPRIYRHHTKHRCGRTWDRGCGHGSDLRRWAVLTVQPGGGPQTTTGQISLLDRRNLLFHEASSLLLSHLLNYQKRGLKNRAQWNTRWNSQHGRVSNIGAFCCAAPKGRDPPQTNLRVRLFTAVNSDLSLSNAQSLTINLI